MYHRAVYSTILQRVLDHDGLFRFWPDPGKTVKLPWPVNLFKKKDQGTRNLTPDNYEIDQNKLPKHLIIFILYFLICIFY